MGRPLAAMLAALFALAGSASAQSHRTADLWAVHIVMDGERATTLRFMDAASIVQTSSQSRRVWVSTYYRPTDNPTATSHDATLLEFNCEVDVYRALEYVGYDSDNKVANDGVTRTWGNITPESVGSDLEAFVCGNAASRAADDRFRRIGNVTPAVAAEYAFSRY